MARLLIFALIIVSIHGNSQDADYYRKQRNKDYILAASSITVSAFAARDIYKRTQVYQRMIVPPIGITIGFTTSSLYIYKSARINHKKYKYVKANT